MKCARSNGLFWFSAGNPFNACLDIDECSAAVCGQNAVCINVPGSYDCRCKKDFIGNPYEICTEENDEERDDLCQTQQCGPNAVCNLGKNFRFLGFQAQKNKPVICNLKNLF